MEVIRSSKQCKKCNSKFDYTANDTWWDYSGFTNAKLVKCTECGCIQAVKYKDSFGLDVNNDKRFYEYKR